MQACLNAASNIIAYDTCAKALLSPSDATLTLAAIVAACAILARIASRYL